jgi:protein required for attachment to host cells
LTKINFFHNPLNRYEKITNNPGITKPMHKVANKVALLAHHPKHAIPRRFLPRSHDSKNTHHARQERQIRPDTQQSGKSKIPHQSTKEEKSQARKTMCQRTQQQPIKQLLHHSYNN